MTVMPTRLPYGPRMTRFLRPLQRAFIVVNRGVMAPLARARLGWLVGNPLTGYVMVLRTRGRRSGRIREAPLGYVIRDGAIYCVAGYGTSTPWYRNLLAHPDVEVLLPTRRLLGRAEPVTDPAEWLPAYRALIASFGFLGRAVVGDVALLEDDELLAGHRALPVIRIRPRAGEPPVEGGRFDPGGVGWCLSAASAIALVAALRRLRRPARAR
jgi:deazaflavin-dependent oxidoreductase (nitroreductase family)